MTAASRRLLAQLVTLADELEQLDARREAIYEERLDLWLRARALDPPMTQRELAIPSRVTKGAVTQALRKHAIQNGRTVAR